MSIRPLGIALLALALLASTAGFTPAFADATGAAVHSASGKVVDANSGLPLAGVKLATEGPTAATTTTRPDGTFTISGLASGEYSLIATRSGYETTASEIFIVGNEDISGLTLAIARTQGSNTGSRVLGRTTVRASQSLQKAATISRTVSAQSLAQQGYFR